ncbi:hypothetical protein [Spirosoma sordidisoli]|uniref:Uncharacterized protein n=1 Tax=Spirosoma sordidisoli TaxID=2502893 RepID=A0A4Q2UP93_9BACT|nr:hypothetical protein [Spirosoma sordidisoli]RYC71264.1 hypothetical protein EQG79_03720 [Spirosoma sordidisoli]
MLRSLFIACVFLCVSLPPAQAQLAQSLRIEIPSDPNEPEAFDVVPLADRGVLMTVRTGGFFDNSPAEFTFQKFDTNLKSLWSVRFKQDIKYRPLLSYNDQQYMYHLFREYDTNRFQFLRLHLDDGVVETIDGVLLDQFDIQQFKVMGSQAYVGGYRHQRPVVMAFSFFDGSAKVLPGLYVNHMDISSLELDETRREVNVLVHSTRRRCRFSIRTYSYDSKLIRVVDFDGAKNSLISGKLLPVNEHESLLVGNYSADCTPYSQGIYVTRVRHPEPGESMAEVTADAVGAIQYIEFSELQNFFNYLKPHRQQKLRARAQKKKEEGKDYKFRYRLLVHDLQPTPTGLTLVAEVYYPQYRTSTLGYSGYLRGADRYDGFRYTHAFVCGFDKQGKLLWDNCLPIKELLNAELTEMVQVSQQGDRMVLAYPNDGEITTEVIQGNKVLKETEKIKIQTSDTDERVTYSAQENLMAWYDRHFLACGFQKIAASKAFPNPREVFYLNKLTYDPDARPASTASQKTAGSGR